MSAQPSYASRPNLRPFLLWLMLFFLAGHPGGFATDAAFQTAGHLLGAWVYGNVFYRWYLLRRDARIASYS